MCVEIWILPKKRINFGTKNNKKIIYLFWGHQETFPSKRTTRIPCCSSYTQHPHNTNKMIHEPKESFDFTPFRLLTPKTASHGVFLAKYVYHDKPLYIQPPPCTLKAGIITGKKGYTKGYTDLVFTHENDEFIQWLEKIEQETIQQLFQNRTEWFETDLEMSDIENSFTSPLKSFKSGKSHVVRVHLHSPLGKSTLKIYDENENEIEAESLTENQKVVSILEFQGVKCSLRNFQIEIELKQMMVLNPLNLFEKCLLVPKNPKTPISNAVENGINE